jgi:hypothetical protein
VNYKKTIIFFVAAIILSSCRDSAIKNNFYGNYFLIATDVGEDLALCYQEHVDDPSYGTVVRATVFALGYNSHFIVVKQHPRTFPNLPDKDITNYFILPIKKGFDWGDMNGLMGPFTLTQFKNQSDTLHLGDIKFTIVYKDLE